ncbi:MAG: hypothetical protein JRN52_00660 [Nitrososphaerota archaeon]|nr:hypothetical protein [Nitrososphaerota archaeon]
MKDNYKSTVRFRMFPADCSFFSATDWMFVIAANAISKKFPDHPLVWTY